MLDTRTPPAPAGIPPASRLRGATIASIGAALPHRAVTNEELGARIGVSDAWIMKRFGVRVRHYSEPGGRLTDLATEAGRVALRRAEIAPEQVDLVLVGTFTSDEMVPHAAPHVAHALGCAGAGAVDIGAACASWVSGLVLAAGTIEAHRAETVLVIGADLLSRRFDPQDEKVSPLMADGAGAALLRATDGPARIGRSVFHSDATAWRSTYMLREDQLLRMEGPETYEVAVKAMVDTTHELLVREGLELDDVDLYVYHQGNARILDAVGRRLKLRPEQVAHYIAEFGNTSSGTVPLALEAARRDGRLQDGMRVFLASIGAGYAWSACIVEWGEA